MRNSATAMNQSATADAYMLIGRPPSEILRLDAILRFASNLQHDGAPTPSGRTFCDLMRRYSG